MADKNEKVLFENNQMEFEIKIEAANPKSKSLKGVGTVYLTNIRVVMICKDQN